MNKKIEKYAMALAKACILAECEFRLTFERGGVPIVGLNIYLSKEKSDIGRYTEIIQSEAVDLLINVESLANETVQRALAALRGQDR